MAQQRVVTFIESLVGQELTLAYFKVDTLVNDLKVIKIISITDSTFPIASKAPQALIRVVVYER